MEFLGSIFGPFMRVCYQIVKNYGLAIILFTFISKVILFPLSYWLQLNSIKMVKMTPALNRIKAKYFGNKDAIADEQAKLYKEHKYNPLASLIPLLIQIVLLMAVVEVISHPMGYLLNVSKDTKNAIIERSLSLNDSIDSTSNYVELAVINDLQKVHGIEAYTDIADQETLNRIKDFDMNFLGYDLSWISVVQKGKALLIPIYAGLSAWLLAFAQNRMNVLQSEQSTFNKYGMMIFSVLLSLYLGSFVPAGVALYWVASNLMAILVQYVCNVIASPKKYIDYKELEDSRKELAALESSSPKKLFGDENSKRSRADYKRFFSIGNKHLVFYSEGSGFYKYFKGFIEYLLEHSNIPIHYITSDPNDQIFEIAKEKELIKPYYIDSTTLITLMMKMDADVVVMTMPDLENFQIKRSYVKKDVHYIFLPHSMDSLNMTMRKASMDHYDSILVAAKSQMDEIVRTEEVYHLPKKTLIECGYPLLDDLIEAYNKLDKHKNEKPMILIAPSWQKDNLIDYCLDQMLDNLKGKGYQIVVRPHPQHVRHMKQDLLNKAQKYEDDPDIQFELDFTSNTSIYSADLVISDWSGIAYEYAYTTLKPVLFIDTPMKVMNPDYKEVDVEPSNIWMRNILGMSMKEEELDQINDKVQYLLNHQEEYHKQIDDLIHKEIYNIGKSGMVGARYIAKVVFDQIEKRQAE